MGGTLADIAHIDVRERCRLLENVRVTVMCDVENPLFGPNGAAWVFGPQKGADDAMAARLDDGLRHLDAAFQQDLGLHLADLPGAGAAGAAAVSLSAREVCWLRIFSIFTVWSGP